MTVKLYKCPIDGWIDIRFKFDKTILKICQSLSTRRYDRDRKIWMIPDHVLTELINKLTNQGINYTDNRHIETDNDLKIIITNRTFHTNFPQVNTRPEMSRLYYLKRPRDGYRLAELMRRDGMEVEVKDRVRNVPLNMESNVTLYPFQEECMDFLREHSYSGLIALEVGLGKTLVTAQSLYEVNKGPALIVAPSSLLYQWQDELLTHYNKQSNVVTSKVKSGQRLQAMKDAIDETGIIITNYEFLKTFKNEIQFEFLVMDECNRIKNWNTQTAKTMSQIPARRVIGLSGTPVENHLGELYNITDQIQPAFFGTMRQFNKDFIYKKENNKYVYKNLEDVYQRLTDLMFRKNKEDALIDLPKLTQQMRVVQLTEHELAGYRKMLVGKHILEAITNAKVFATSSALRMKDIDISSKEKELFALLDELSGKKIVFSESKQEIKRLDRMIEEPTYALHGDISKVERANRVKEFKKSDEGILLMTKVGTYGLNLQFTNILINMDLPWTHSQLEQRIGRIQRAKSEFDKCFVFNMASQNTIDSHVINLITKKKELSDQTVDGEKKAKNWIQEQFINGLGDMGLKLDRNGMVIESRLR